MPKPTLLQKGKLRAPNEDPKLQQELDQYDRAVDYVLKWFRDRQSHTGVANRFLVLQAQTASGKSTAFPAELYIEMIDKPRKQGVRERGGIICTQPRTITTIRNVRDIVYNSSDYYTRNFRIGDNIGWSTKYNKFKPRTYGLLSATIGTLTMQLKSFTDEELINMYKYILIDETHERDLQVDMAIYMLKNFLVRNQHNPRCPFVCLMSATIEPMKFINYFGGTLLGNFIFVEGGTYPRDLKWDWNGDNTVKNYTEEAAKLVDKICRGDGKNDASDAGDILIFMPGKKEITDTERGLQAVNAKLHKDGLNIFSVSAIDSRAQQIRNYDFMKLDIPLEQHRVEIDGKLTAKKPTRRVIISTNMAETGLTLPNLKYVIDAGYNKEIEFNPNYNVRGLITKPAPQSRITQRIGRAGRKFPGVFYPLYPRYVYDKLQVQQYPQILLEDISTIIIDIIGEQLRSKRLGAQSLGSVDINNLEFSVTDIDMLDVPTPDSLANALEKLYALGFVDPAAPRVTGGDEGMITNNGITSGGTTSGTTNNGITSGGATKYILTQLGEAALDLAIPPEHLRMIFAGWSWDVSVLDLITISAYLQIEYRDFIEIPEGSKDRDINWQVVYATAFSRFDSVAKSESAEKIYYKYKLLLGDDFIGGLILMDAFKAILKLKGTVEEMQKWCAHAYVSYAAMIDFIRLRDDIIEQLITAGYDIFANEEHALSHVSETQFMTAITKLKYCIYDGFRLRQLHLTQTNAYVTTHGNMGVYLPETFSENEKSIALRNKYKLDIYNPKRLLYNDLSVKYNKKSKMYNIICDRACMLDGFVNYDDNFLFKNVLQ